MYNGNRQTCLFEAWVELFPDAAMGNAVLDRLVSQSHAIVLEGESYRRHFAAKIAQLQKEENQMTTMT